MAKLPDWIEVKELKVVGNKPDWYLDIEIKVKYIPLGLFVKYILKRIGFRFWLYPWLINYCLNNTGLIIR